jgi:hypothetical protein
MPYFVGRPDLNNGSRLWKEQKPADEEGKTPTNNKKEDKKENKAPVMVPVYLKVNNCTNFSITVNGDTYTQNDLIFTGNADYNPYETNFTFVQNSTISVVINSAKTWNCLALIKATETPAISPFPAINVLPPLP